jgi:hypothetical protein
MARRYSARKWMATAAAVTLAAGLGGIGTGHCFAAARTRSGAGGDVRSAGAGHGSFGSGAGAERALQPHAPADAYAGAPSRDCVAFGEETRGPALALMNFATGEFLARKAIGEDRRTFVELSVAAADGSVRVNGVATGLIVGRGSAWRLWGFFWLSRFRWFRSPARFRCSTAGDKPSRPFPPFHRCQPSRPVCRQTKQTKHRRLPRRLWLSVVERKAPEGPVRTHLTGPSGAAVTPPFSTQSQVRTQSQEPRGVGCDRAVRGWLGKTPS